jgi:hypothetical protein
MPTMSVDGQVYQVRIKWLLHGQQCLNVLNFLNRGSQDLITGLVQPILDCITTHLIPVLSHDITLEGADVRNITGSVAQEETVSLTSGNVGDESVDSLPSTNTAVVRLKTTHPGKTGRGRMALPGIPEDKQALSALDPAFVTAAVAFLACMAAAYINSDPLATPFFHWSVWSRKDTAAYPITSTSVNNIVGSMRSRKVH